MMLHTEYVSLKHLHEAMKVADFAAKKHASQRRKDGSDTPYINHPLGVALIVAAHYKKSKQVFAQPVIFAAMLHDTLEDTDTTYAELKAKFGEEVADLVKEVTDDKSLPKSERKKQQIAHAKTISKEAKVIKMADKLYNLRDLIATQPPDWSVEYIQGYFLWSKAVVDEMRGTSKNMEAQLDELFNGQFFHKASQQHYPCLPPKAATDPQQALEDYYALCK